MKRYWHHHRNKVISIAIALALSCVQANALAADVRVAIQNTNTGQGLEDVVVEVLLPTQLQAQFAGGIQGIIDQQDKEFVDFVTVVSQGSRISFPNSDNILHHVYSFSDAKVFELPLYGSGELNDYFQEFDTPGVIELGCNIHDWMLGYIYVAATSLVAKTDLTGTVQIEDVPEGTFTVRIWHPQSSVEGGVVEQEVEFTATETAIVRLAIEPVRSDRLRRAPGAGRTRYR
jgi:plastocyanin